MSGAQSTTAAINKNILRPGTTNAQSRTVDGTSLWKQYHLGSANVDESQIPRFNSIRDQGKRMVRLTPTAANLTDRIEVNGPWLHPEELDPVAFQKKEFCAFFGQFGQISSITVGKKAKSTITFDNCDSVARCTQQPIYKIRGQDFLVWETRPSGSIRKKLRATRNLSSESASVPNNQIQLPPDMTNKIFVSGPLLHPQEMDPQTFQKEEFRTYFGQFGKVINVTVIKYDSSTVTFTNCDSAAKCIQQRTHNIRGQDFIVHPAKPSNGMRKKLKCMGSDGNTRHSRKEKSSFEKDK
ncbi:hypothetical protein DdX_22036 [Ditylenchus destructor]|uniref:RRM domain-containing protein n=1 Tax=Ditylenchus destructor TaxID=166010 RepID=A0AAD4MES9_9BILA|nr:hypothetical protein DdX_22036 [Ditylenchus destructor]